MSDLQAEVFPERVELEVLDSVPPVTMTCAMASFSDRGLTLTTPDPAAMETFAAGTKVRASYGDPAGYCHFDSEVVEATAAAAEGDRGFIRVLPPKQVITEQRRRHVRSAVEVEIAVALLVDKKGLSFLSAPGEVRNMGGGGLMMIIADHPALTVGSELALAIPAPGGGPVLAIGRIVQLEPDPDGPMRVRVAFTLIDAVGRDRIERFVYRRTGGSAPAKLWTSGKITLIQA